MPGVELAFLERTVADGVEDAAELITIEQGAQVILASMSSGTIPGPLSQRVFAGECQSLAGIALEELMKSVKTGDAVPPVTSNGSGGAQGAVSGLMLTKLNAHGWFSTIKKTGGDWPKIE